MKNVLSYEGISMTICIWPTQDVLFSNVKHHPHAYIYFIASMLAHWWSEMKLKEITRKRLQHINGCVNFDRYIIY